MDKVDRKALTLEERTGGSDLSPERGGEVTDMSSLLTRRVLARLATERRAQDVMHGFLRDYPDEAGPWTGSRVAPAIIAQSLEMDRLALLAARQAADTRPSWRNIFLEEVYEAFTAKSETEMEAELTQAVAVGVAWLEALEERRRTEGRSPFRGRRFGFWGRIRFAMSGRLP